MEKQINLSFDEKRNESARSRLRLFSNRVGKGEYSYHNRFPLSYESRQMGSISISIQQKQGESSRNQVFCYNSVSQTKL